MRHRNYLAQKTIDNSPGWRYSSDQKKRLFKFPIRHRSAPCDPQQDWSRFQFRRLWFQPVFVVQPCNREYLRMTGGSIGEQLIRSQQVVSSSLTAGSTPFTWAELLTQTSRGASTVDQRSSAPCQGAARRGCIIGIALTSADRSFIAPIISPYYSRGPQAAREGGQHGLPVE